MTTALRTTIALVLFAALTTLTACSPSSSSNSSAATPGKPPIRQVSQIPITDAQCALGTPIDTIYVYGWQLEFADQGHRVTATWMFTSGKLNMWADCHNGAAAHVSSQINVTADTIQTLDSDSKTDTINGQSCYATVAPGTWKYKLQGRCLKLTYGNDTMTLLAH